MSVARVFLALVVTLLSGQSPAADACNSLDDCVARMRSLAKTASSDDSSLTREESELTERAIEFDGAVARLVPLLASPDKHLAKLASASLASAGRIDAKYFPQIVAGLDRGLGWSPPALCAMPGEAAAGEAVARYLVSQGAPQNQEAFAVVRCGRRALPFIADAAKCTKGCPPQTYSNLTHVLHEMDPKISPAIGNPLMEIARRLSEAKSPFAARLMLRDIAELGADGRDAGEEVVRLLRSDDWGSRVAAARALGFIDYQAAVPLLIQAIADPEDVRLSWVAVQSLGRLRNKTAVDALQRAANQHWYSPVRRAATEALGHIRGGSPYERQYHPDNFPFEFFAYEHIADRRDSCSSIAIPLLPEEQARKLRATSAGVSKLGHKKQVEPEGPGKKPRTVMEIPQMALRVADGWLTGADRGEWGGELVFIGDDRSQRVLLEQNVHDIIKLGPRIVALTGLAHLSMNEGMIYELHQGATGAWIATPWRALPGAPERSRLVDTGELAIDVNSGGSILVAPDGSMRMACNAKARTT